MGFQIIPWTRLLVQILDPIWKLCNSMIRHFHNFTDCYSDSHLKTRKTYNTKPVFWTCPDKSWTPVIKCSVNTVTTWFWGIIHPGKFKFCIPNEKWSSLYSGQKETLSAPGHTQKLSGYCICIITLMPNLKCGNMTHKYWLWKFSCALVTFLTMSIKLNYLPDNAVT